MSDPLPPNKICNLAGFIRQFLEQHQTRPDQPFCFILGAGASRDSGIKTAKEMALDWLKNFHEDHHQTNSSFEQWLHADGPAIPGFDAQNPARHYSEIYELVYREKEQAGFSYLEKVMAGIEPSYGYSVLSYLLSETHHHIVITTNFDNLVTDALAIHADTFPIVVNEDSLVPYVRANVRRPLVAKIHGSLGFKPKSRGVDLTLDDNWKKALTTIFRTHTPVVIGYDGNDGSLMKLLTDMPIDEGPDFIWWCYHCESGDDVRIRAAAQPEHVRQLIRKRRAQFVPIPSFDLLMLQLLTKMELEIKNVPDLVRRLADRSTARMKRYQEQREKLGDKLGEPAKAPTGKSSTPTSAPERRDLADAAALLAKGTDSKPWWQWQSEIDLLADPAEQDAKYHEATDALPQSAKLLGNYAIFLKNIRKDFDRAEIYYQRAIEAEPANARHLGNYAVFLNNIRKDFDKAETYYQRALEADPKHANTLGNYAVFLANIRQEFDKAEIYYRRALEAGSKQATVFLNYGQFAIGRGQITEGITRLRQAWEGLHHSDVQDTAETSFCLWLSTGIAGNAETVWEAVYKCCIVKGFRRPVWSFDALLAQAEKVLTALDFKYAQALAAAYLDETKVAELSNLPRWQDLQPIDAGRVNADGSLRAL